MWQSSEKFLQIHKKNLNKNCSKVEQKSAAQVKQKKKKSLEKISFVLITVISLASALSFQSKTKPTTTPSLFAEIAS